MAEDPIERLMQEIQKLKEEVELLRSSAGLPKPPVLPTLPPTPPGPGRVLFGGRRTPTRVLDTTTGKYYGTKTELGKMLGYLAGALSDDRFAYYKLIAKFPGRFKDIV